jgi:hypothetical protein
MTQTPEENGPAKFAHKLTFLIGTNGDRIAAAATLIASHDEDTLREFLNFLADAVDLSQFHVTGNMLRELGSQFISRKVFASTREGEDQS